ncbi:MAG: metabolite traffic protein EboE [Verrucomicrobia bacterium]|nr:metabolite traffic protein EboE [Verrucomicrobiota bacterium]
MRIGVGSGPELVYCLNIHPGETWAENLHAIETQAAAVKSRIAPRRPFGLGLRLSALAARTVDVPVRLAAARARFDALGMHAVTINGFPYGRFHGAGVKERVYAPDWRSDARLTYTLRLARILAAWLPPDGEGSVSTVPGSFGPWIEGEFAVAAMVRRWVRLCAGLDALRSRTGREIHVGLEPEPDCLVETAAGFAEFHRRRMVPDVCAGLRAAFGWPLRRAETVVRRHLGICFDTCHSAVGGEDPANAVERLVREGIRISKIQVSAAVAARNTAAGRAGLRAFADPVYLHQTRAMDGAWERARWTDLGPALRDLARMPADLEARVHCHVPLFHKPAAPLRSTAGELGADFWRAAVRATSTLEIETYTFLALPARIRRIGLTESIVREYRWVLDHLGGRRSGSQERRASGCRNLKLETWNLKLET